MNNPGFKVRLIGFLVLGSIAAAVSAMAESPEPGAPRNRTRPQIIYHLPPNYAAMLHSQAKGQNSDLPNDSSMPNPLQNSRPNTNAVQQQPAPPASFEEQRVKPKLKESRPQVHSRSSAKSQGHGNPHGNKSHKK